ncbi:MAG: tetratricopeptide repeat protein [candidate division Zixibacteria bacterium]|nr:tetratricopeptide repeat protein [candidate division Zixibacteria bacterium]
MKPIGQGGTAKLALIKRESDGRLFAYKYPLDNAPSFAGLAAREVSLTAPHRFPGVVRAEFSPDKTCPGLVLPYLRGLTLERQGPMKNITAALNTLSSLAILLHYLELRGVIHGDIKPHNIFLPQGFTEKDLAGDALFYPRLLDFSMGELVTRKLGGRIGVGTLGYAAPETTRNSEINSRTEIFSLGAIAYWLLSGKHPFLENQRDPAKIAAAVRETTQAPLSELMENIHPGLSELVDSMLSKEPGLRPKNGFEICQTLEQLGATYPYTRAIQPRHLLDSADNFTVSSLSGVSGLNLPTRNELHKISGGNQWKIRLILDANFRAGNLIWRQGEIRSSDAFLNYHWPACLRRVERREFRALTITEARWVIKCSVAGGVHLLTRIIHPPKHLRPAIATSSLVELLRPELGARTMQAQSLILADKLAASKRFEDELELCARLYLQARQLRRGLKLTSRWCDILAKENRSTEALSLLESAEELATEVGEVDDLIEALHLDGDIRKSVGDMNGAESRYRRLLDVAGERRSRILAETYKDLGDLYKLKQEFSAGLAALNKARDLYASFDDQAELARVANNIGNIYWINAEHEKALSAYREALKIHRLRGDLADTSSTVNNIGVIYASTGRISRATRVFSISLAMKRQVGNKEEIARTLNNLGYTQFCLGDIARALPLLEEALELNRQIGSKKEVIYNLDSLAACEIIAGRFEDALRDLREGKQLAVELQDEPFKTLFDLNLAGLYKRMGHWNHAHGLIRRCLKTAEQLEDNSLLLRGNLQLADMYRRAGQREKSVSPAARARQLARDIADKQAEIQALLLETNQREEALNRAQTLAKEVKSPRDLAQVRLALAEEQADNGSHEQAASILKLAGEYFECVDEDIDHVWYWRVYGQIALAGARDKRLVEKLSRVLEKAQKAGEKAESWKLAVVVAEACIRSGDFEKAYAALRTSTRTSKELQSELLDKQARREFLRQDFVRQIGDQISQLKGKMNVL